MPQDSQYVGIVSSIVVVPHHQPHARLTMCPFPALPKGLPSMGRDHLDPQLVEYFAQVHLLESLPRGRVVDMHIIRGKVQLSQFAEAGFGCGEHHPDKVFGQFLGGQVLCFRVLGLPEGFEIGRDVGVVAGYLSYVLGFPEELLKEDRRCFDEVSVDPSHRLNVST